MKRGQGLEVLVDGIVVVFFVVLLTWLARGGH